MSKRKQLPLTAYFGVSNKGNEQNNVPRADRLPLSSATNATRPKKQRAGAASSTGVADAIERGSTQTSRITANGIVVTATNREPTVMEQHSQALHELRPWPNPDQPAIGHNPASVAPVHASAEPTSTSTNDVSTATMSDVQKPLAAPSCQSVLVSQPSKNLAHALMQRAIGRRTILPIPQSTHWKTSTWLKLATSESGDASHPPKHLQWDDMGVLLAAADDYGLVRIYDWDMVVATDRKGRNLESKRQLGCFAIDPIIRLPVLAVSSRSAARISLLQWNPFQQDEIAIGTGNGALFIYDLGAVNAWAQQGARQDGSRAPPPRRVFETPPGSITSILFAEEGRRLFVTVEDKMLCFDPLRPKNPLWTFTWKRFSTIVSIAPDTLLAGSKNGYFGLINWKKLTRTSSFSRALSPTLSDQWLSYRGQDTPGSNHMAICQIIVDKFEENAGSHVYWGRCSLTWATACGWVLEATLESPTQAPKSCRIVGSTPPKRVVDVMGAPTQMANASWSLPAGSCASAGSRALVAWEDVAQVTQVLPSCDKRVLAQHQTIRANDKPSIKIWWIASSRIQSASFSRKTGRPVSIAIHPSHEWIVVSTEHRGVLVVAHSGRSTA